MGHTLIDSNTTRASMVHYSLLDRNIGGINVECKWLWSIAQQYNKLTCKLPGTNENNGLINIIHSEKG